MTLNDFLKDTSGVDGFMVAVAQGYAPKFVHLQSTSEESRLAAIAEAKRLLREMNGGRAIVFRVEAVVDQPAPVLPEPTVTEPVKPISTTSFDVGQRVSIIDPVGEKLLGTVVARNKANVFVHWDFGSKIWMPISSITQESTAPDPAAPRQFKPGDRVFYVQNWGDGQKIYGVVSHVVERGNQVEVYANWEGPWKGFGQMPPDRLTLVSETGQ